MNNNGHTPLSKLPRVSERRIALRVTPAAERAIRHGHPWVFANAIQQQSHQGQVGDTAVIFDRKRRFLAIGLYDPYAPIRVRILHTGQPVQIDTNWFRQQIQQAAARRQTLPDNTTGYRLVHGENDGLPGLVIDRYDQVYVMRLDTAAWVPHLNDVLAALTETTGAAQIVLRLSRTVQQIEDGLYGLKDGVLISGPPLPEMVHFQENGLTFEVDVRHGQKTGFFLDQRDNRARVETLAANKQVLNVFAYTGGFSLYAARGGAQHVVSLDISQPALAAALRNFRLNQEAVAQTSHDLLLGDAFHALRQLRENRRRFDMVIIDPPSFAKQRTEVARAVTAYARLTRLGLRVLRPGGTLVMASCSSRVTAEMFFATVHKAAVEVERPLHEIERTFHALDHPIRFKEGAYLKCLFATA
ncbi:MAG: class I SAM-dependent methyltransferase [Anaerolineales bacterium]|nr:class I SAM-dependent methyltransferase [Anaerolineales bacterium]